MFWHEPHCTFECSNRTGQYNSWIVFYRHLARILKQTRLFQNLKICRLIIPSIYRPFEIEVMKLRSGHVWSRSWKLTFVRTVLYTYSCTIPFAYLEGTRNALFILVISLTTFNSSYSTHSSHRNQWTYSLRYR